MPCGAPGHVAGQRAGLARRRGGQRGAAGGRVLDVRPAGHSHALSQAGPGPGGGPARPRRPPPCGSYRRRTSCRPGWPRRPCCRTGRTCSSWAGSTSGRQPPPAILRLNPVTGSTTSAGRLAAATPGAAGATLNGRDFLFGGGSQAGTAPAQQIDRAADRRRGRHGHGGRPAARAAVRAGRGDHRRYRVPAGRRHRGGPAGDVLASTDGRHFRTVARLPVPVRDPAVAALGDQIWVFGGQAATGPVSDIQRVTVPSAAPPGTAASPAPRSSPAQRSPAPATARPGRCTARHPWSGTSRAR